MKRYFAFTLFIFGTGLLWGCSMESERPANIWPDAGNFEEDVSTDGDAARGGDPAELSEPAEIEFPAETLVMELDQTLRPQAVVRDQDGDILEDFPINWRSWDESILRISSGGVAIAMGVGETTLTAEAGAIRANWPVEVLRERVASLTIYPREPEVFIGDQIQFVADARTAQNILIEHPGRLRWSSDDEEIATIDDDGLATAQGLGETLIRVQIEDIEARATLRVFRLPVERIEVTPSGQISIATGESRQLVATVYDVDGRQIFDREILWESSDEAVATVDEDGLVLARSAGHAKIFASVEDKTVFVNVQVTFSAQRIAAGDGYGCAAAMNRVFCWDGTGSAVVIATGMIRDLSLGPSRGCLVSEEGSVSCFDKGDWTLQEVPTLTDIEAISVGEEHSCALKEDGAVYCWGDNSWGQLGRSGGATATPVKVNSSQEFQAIAVGGRHSCAVDARGDAWCWGANDRGQLAGYSSDRRATPFLAEGGYKFARLSAGADFTCGTHPSGAPLCWGAGDKGQLGNGLAQDRDVPTTVSRSFNAVYATAERACGLDAAGFTFCWGDGQSVPQNLSTAPRFVEISVQNGLNCGRTADHFLYCWKQGTNYYQPIHLMD